MFFDWDLMDLRLKFNLVLVIVFLAGFAATGLVSRQLLQDNAREEVLRNARLLMDRQRRPAGRPRRLSGGDANTLAPGSARCPDRYSIDSFLRIYIGRYRPI